MPERRTQLVRMWKPGDRVGTLFFISARWRDHELSRFCSHSEINGIVRDFLYPIPREEQEAIAVSLGIAVYAENGGHKRVILGRWHPGENLSIEQFSQQCNALASEYKVVYPPNESIEIHESDE